VQPIRDRNPPPSPRLWHDSTPSLTGIYCISVSEGGLRHALVRRCNLSSIVLLNWTFGHITNLMMKTESVSEASVDLKKLRLLFAQYDDFWRTSNVKSRKFTKTKINASYISALIRMGLFFLFFLLMHFLHSLRTLSR
jgi:hypothetical protein